MKNLVVATSNPGKLQEMQEYLNDCGWELTLQPPEIEIEETGTTFAENARLKASVVAKTLKKWAIADDSGLSVKVLNGAPGIYSARYAPTNQARIIKLLEELQDKKDRSAEFVCVVAIANPNGKIIIETEGVCKGEITTAPQGSSGFGYDPIFYVPEYQQTFAQMSPELKQQVSHRGQAFKQLLPQLSQIKE